MNPLAPRTVTGTASSRLELQKYRPVSVVNSVEPLAIADTEEQKEGAAKLARHVRLSWNARSGLRDAATNLLGAL